MTKKVFDSTDVAEMFITTPETTETAEKTDAYEPKVEKKSEEKPKVERKTRHLQLLLTPSLYEQLYNAYEKSGERSLNDYVNKLFAKHAK